MDTPRCYLVDDEELSLSTLNRMLSDSGRVDVVGLSTDPAVAVEEIRHLQPDAIFLDIHMPEIDGFELLSRISRQPFIIFTTAYDQHALRAFETNSIDYLLKPIEEQRLIRALDKLEGRLSNRGGLNSPPADEIFARITDALKPRPWLRRVATQIGQGITLIEVDRITHFIAEDRYSFACTDVDRFLLSLSLTELESRLNPECFLRIHRSAIVNLNFVERVSNWFAGRLYIRLRDRARTELTVSRANVTKLRQALGL